MAKREIGTSLKLDGEAQFKTAITNINQELRVLSSEMGAAVSSFDKSGASISDLKAKGDIYEKQLESQKEKLSVLQNAVETAREAQAKAAQTAAEMAEKYGENSDEAKKASEAVAGITKKLNDYQIQANNTTKNINQLEAAQKTNNDEIKKLQQAKLTNLVEGFKKVATEAGKAASMTAKITAKTLTVGIDAGVKALTAYTTAVTAAATAVAGLCKEAVETGMAFDSSMSQVAATMGTSVDQIDYLADAAKEMGATTAFTASEAADGLNILAMAGMDMKEAVTASSDSTSMLETTLNMASAGALSLEDSAGYLAGTLKGFGDDASNAAYYADLMAKGATLANTSVGDLGAGLSGISATANSYNQSADSMTLSLLKLADANVTGEKASTSLKAAMSNLYTPTDTAKKTLDSLGVSAYDSSGNARDFNTVVDELSNALSGLSDEEANSYKNAIFGIQGLDAFNKMANTSAESVKKFKDGLAEATGSTADQAATQLDNLQGDITLLGSAADGAKMAIYEALNGTDSRLRQFVQQATEELGALTSAFEAGGIEGVLEHIQAIIPIIGESIVNGISEMLPTFLENFNNFVLMIVQSISETLPTAVDSILPAMITGCTNLVTGLVQEIPSFVPTVLDGAITLFQGILDGLNEILDELIPMLPDIVNDISAGLIENIPALIEGAFEFFTGILEAFTQAAPSILTAVAELIPVICDSLIENTPTLVNAGFDLFVALVANLPQIIIEIVKAVPKIITCIVDDFKERMSVVADIGKNIMAGIGDGIINGITAVKEKISAAGEKIMNSFKEFFGIHSPSTKMKEEVGYNLADGVSEGFIEQMEQNTDEMNASVPKDYTIGIKITDEKTAKKAIDTIVADYKKGRLTEQQADKLAVDTFRNCEQNKIDIREYTIEKIAAIRKEASDIERKQLENDMKTQITAYEKQADEIRKAVQKTAENLTESYKSMYTFEKDEDGNIISAKTTNKMIAATKELDAFNAEIEKLQSKGVSGGLLSQLDGMSRDEGAAVAEYWNTLSDKQLKALEQNWEKYQESANKLSERIHAEETESLARNTLENFNAVITDSSVALDEMGLQIMAGLRQGMTGEAANNELQAACDNIVTRFKDYFGIASPSKLMKKVVGINLADGVGVGFTEQMSKISSDMQKAVPTNFDFDVEVDAAATARRRYGGSAGGNSGGISFVQNNYSPAALDAATINRQTRQGLQLAHVMR